MSDKDTKKRQRKRQQVAPESITEESELESVGMEEHGHNNVQGSVSLKFDTVAQVIHGAQTKASGLKMVANVKSAGNKWMEYTTQRRIRRKTGASTAATAGLLGEDDDDKAKMSGIGLDEIHSNFVTEHIIRRNSSAILNVGMAVNSNRALIQHFAKMADAPHEEAKIDLNFVESLIHNGADINTTDKYGQTVLHEAARAWHVDVARWLLQHKCDVNKPDDYGRTSLHVAAAVDCPEMVNLFIEWGADKEALTKGEEQTPVFYAAKSDATNSLKALIKKQCKYKLVRDYKGRTPIHVAAELDRSETARLLLELNAPIGVSDNHGQKAITWMITKMAPVANEALNQFRSIDRHNRKQYFYLNLLVQDRKLDPKCRSQTPDQVAATFRQFDILLNETMTRLLEVKWKQFGRFWAIWNLSINFLYILIWTLIGILVEYDDRHIYNFPDDWYRVVLWVIAVGATAWQITEEVMEFFRSKRNHMNWEKWRQQSIEKDIEYCHPRWPEEREYLESELEALQDLNPKYFSDAWNIFDWLCYILLLVDICTHVVDVISHSEGVARAHIRLMAVTIILLWLRLMKNARAFALLGPFIVMLGHMLKDCARFLFLYMEFYLPFMAVFWMIYGGTKKSEKDQSQIVVVDGYRYPAELIFSLFRLTLVDDYDYDGMKSIDQVFTDIVLMAWFLLSSVLCMNLFIALLSDTFQRVYDNAQANSVMQRAITILNIWEGISPKRKERFFAYIDKECSPLMEYYDDDLTQSGEEDLKKITFQIKDKLDDFTETFKHQFGDMSTANILLGMDNAKPQGSNGGGGGGGGGKPGGGPGGGGRGSGTLVTKDRFDQEVSVMQTSLHELQVQQENFMQTYRRDMDGIQALLKQMVSSAPGSTGLRAPESGSLSIDSPGTESTETQVSKLKRKKKQKPNPMDMVLSVEMLEPTAGDHPRSRSPHSSC